MGALQKTFFRHVEDATDDTVKAALEELDYEICNFIKPKRSRGSQIKFKFACNSLWIFETVWFDRTLEEKNDIDKKDI